MIKLKGIFPTEIYTLTTELTVVATLTKIHKNIQPKKDFSFFNFNNTDQGLYEGEVFADGFKIKQVAIGKRNSFAPLLIGNVTAGLNKTKIDITAVLPTFPKVFMVLWLSFVGAFCFFSVIALLINPAKIYESKATPFLLIPFGMLFFGFALTYFGFKTESKKSKNYLKNLLQGEDLHSLQ